MTKTTSTLNLQPEDNYRLVALCGEYNSHLKQIERQLAVEITTRGSAFAVSGDSENVKKVHRVLRQLYKETADRDGIINDEMVFMAISNHTSPEYNQKRARPNESSQELGKVNDLHKNGSSNSENTIEIQKANGLPSTAPLNEKLDKKSVVKDFSKSELKNVVLNTPKMKVVGKNPSQRHYIGQMLSHDVSFGIGPAGTGKTYLAVACAVHALTHHEIQRIILVRPAVEAGERLGFLPGDIGQKVDPYLRPLYDAMYDMLGFDKVAKMIEKNIIEIAPLAYMRGRTLNDAAVILDEAQNTTSEQMKMFLTRVGFGSKAMITGDLTQIDLPKHMKSGLRHAAEVLDGIDDIGFTYFSPDDVVRHPLVQRIVKAYESYDKEESNRSGGN